MADSILAQSIQSSTLNEGIASFIQQSKCCCSVGCACGEVTEKLCGAVLDETKNTHQAGTVEFRRTYDFSSS